MISGSNLKDLLGKNLLDLEKKGLFTFGYAISVGKQKKVSVVQETKSGRKILAVGNPVFNENGELHRIIIASRDITEATRLKTELHEIKKISEQYKKELDDFKNKDCFLKKLIYCSPKMEQIINQAKKIADFLPCSYFWRIWRRKRSNCSGNSSTGKPIFKAIFQN